MGNKRKVREIRESELVVCPFCGCKNTLGEWDSETYSLCTNREMKRDFVSLAFKKSWLKKSDLYYKCPSCKELIQSNHLKLDNVHDKGLASLGGDSIFDIEI